MDSSQKKVVQESGRWLRVGTLALTTLSPLINLLAERIRERQEAATTLKKIELAQNISSAVTGGRTRERLQAVNAALTEVLEQLQHQPDNQELLKKGEALSEELQDRWSKLSQRVAERGSEFSQLMAERSSELSHELAKRSQQVSKELRTRGRAAQQGLAEQDRRLWIFLGFGVGVSIASIITFLLLRKRFKPLTNDDIPIQLTFNNTDATFDHVNNGNIRSFSAVSAARVAPSTKAGGQTQAEGTPNVPLAEDQLEVGEPGETALPADARLIGVVSSKQYYPPRTPITDITKSSGQPLALIYFESEEEAEAQGYTAAR